MSTSHLIFLPNIEEGLALARLVRCSTNTGGKDLLTNEI
jgi:hypothetical protein